MKLEERISQSESNYDAWMDFGIDNLEAIADFENLIYALDQCKKHFHKGTEPYTFEYSREFAKGIIEIALERVGAKSK